MCWEEVKRRARRGKALEGWEEERKRFYEDKGWRIEDVESRRGGPEIGGEEMVRGERRRQERERWERIRETRYNGWYKRVKGEGIPGYLKRGWGESRWQSVARFRLGNEMRGERYWEDERKRVCRVCG